jgi:hypothetical protein
MSTLTASNESFDKRDFDDRSSPPRQVTRRADDAGGSDAQGDSGMATAQGPARTRPVPPADAREPQDSAPGRAPSHIDDAALCDTGRGHREGRAANRTFIDRAPACPSHSKSSPMIAFVDECWRLTSRTVARALGLISRLRDVTADVREIRRKLEAELFHDRYRLVSKNDDDLPIVR